MSTSDSSRKKKNWKSGRSRSGGGSAQPVGGNERKEATVDPAIAAIVGNERNAVVDPAVAAVMGNVKTPAVAPAIAFLLGENTADVQTTTIATVKKVSFLGNQESEESKRSSDSKSTSSSKDIKLAPTNPQQVHEGRNGDEFKKNCIRSGGTEKSANWKPPSRWRKKKRTSQKEDDSNRSGDTKSTSKDEILDSAASQQDEETKGSPGTESTSPAAKDQKIGTAANQQVWNVNRWVWDEGAEASGDADPSKIRKRKKVAFTLKRDETDGAADAKSNFTEKDNESASTVKHQVWKPNVYVWDEKAELSANPLNSEETKKPSSAQKDKRAEGSVVEKLTSSERVNEPASAVSQQDEGTEASPKSKTSKRRSKKKKPASVQEGEDTKESVEAAKSTSSEKNNKPASTTAQQGEDTKESVEAAKSTSSENNNEEQEQEQPSTTVQQSEEPNASVDEEPSTGKKKKKRPNPHKRKINWIRKLAMEEAAKTSATTAPEQPNSSPSVKFENPLLRFVLPVVEGIPSGAHSLELRMMLEGLSSSGGYLRTRVTTIHSGMPWAYAAARRYNTLSTIPEVPQWIEVEESLAQPEPEHDPDDYVPDDPEGNEIGPAGQMEHEPAAGAGVELKIVADAAVKKLDLQKNVESRSLKPLQQPEPEHDHNASVTVDAKDDVVNPVGKMEHEPSAGDKAEVEATFDAKPKELGPPDGVESGSLKQPESEHDHDDSETADAKDDVVNPVGKREHEPSAGDEAEVEATFDAKPKELGPPDGVESGSLKQPESEHDHDDSETVDAKDDVVNPVGKMEHEPSAGEGAALEVVVDAAPKEFDPPEHEETVRPLPAAEASSNNTDRNAAAVNARRPEPHLANPIPAEVANLLRNFNANHGGFEVKVVYCDMFNVVVRL